jgi:SAM-dependent methyltransferase
MLSRHEEIHKAILKLETFKLDPRYAGNADILYAIDENLLFLKAIQSLPRYFTWLVGHARTIDGARLKELTDFPVEEWDVAMHSRLMEIERNKRIKLGAPLREKILHYILNQESNQQNSQKTLKPLTIVNLGAGGMEVDRQVGECLLEKGYQGQVIFIGIDKSSTTHAIAKNNLKSFGNKVTILEIDNLTEEKLADVKKNQKGIVYILSKNDIFTLEKSFSSNCFDMVYNSLFLHHLEPAQRGRIIEIMKKIAKKVLIYEGYRTWKVIIPQTIVAWNYPIFLSATVFSNIRFNTKKEVQSAAKGKGNATFYGGTGHYLLEYI